MTLTKIASTGVEDSLRWVLGANGTSDYTFTGPGLTGTVNDPTIYLTRGHTYIFQNNSGGHPFYIKTSIANGGTNDAYNTGVTNNGGGNGTEIVFTVPHDSPDILYYQCSSHSSMAGQFNIAGSVADGSISTAKLADDAVTNDKLANSVVASIAANTAKTSNATHTGDVTGSTSLTIANSAVTTAKIADQAVTTGKLANDAVDYGKLADGAVLASKLATNSVQTAKIVDQAVTLAKLPHGTSSNNGKFLRANNGADPSFETVNTDLVADTTPQLGGNLATNSNDILFADNDSAKFGAGTDLEIYHDPTSSDSIIKHQNENGHLRILSGVNGNGGIKINNRTDNAAYIHCNNEGSVDLYNNGSKKFETTGTGAYQYGNLRLPDNDAKIELKDGNNYIQFLNTNKEFKFMNAWGAGEFTFYPGGSERLRIDSNGVKFNGDTASANALNDYEEGTWTPNMFGNGSGSYTVRNGNYTKIGDIVHLHFYIDFYNGNAGGGSAFIMYGLPFTSTGLHAGSVMFKYHNANNNRFYVLHIGSNVNYITAYGSENNANWEALGADGTFEMIGSITYRTNS